MFDYLPFDRNFNVAVLQVAHRLFPTGYDVGEGAPDTLDGLKEHISRTGRMLVSSENSEGTIFGCEETNWAFRAWHDWCHWRYDLPFTLQGELDAWVIQVSHLHKLGLWSQFFEDLLYIEVGLQAIHYEITGDFPEDQRAFTRTALAEMGRSIPASATAYVDFLRNPNVGDK